MENVSAKFVFYKKLPERAHINIKINFIKKTLNVWGVFISNIEKAKLYRKSHKTFIF